MSGRLRDARPGLTFEQALSLHRHRPGTLARHGEFLYRRTRGMIGSLSRVIRGAATDAIQDGTEKITKAHLEDRRSIHRKPGGYGSIGS